MNRSQQIRIETIVDAASAAKALHDKSVSAAGPELLAALKDFVSHATLFHEHEFSELITAGRAAIAKAEGR